MAKIYISKSNQANPEHLLNLRTKLKNQNHDVIEFMGGNYAEFIANAFDGVAKVYIISHPDCFSDGKDRVNLGRGIAGEAMKAYDLGIELFSYQGETVPIKSIQGYSEVELQKKNSWQQRFAYAVLDKLIIPNKEIPELIL